MKKNSSKILEFQFWIDRYESSYISWLLSAKKFMKQLQNKRDLSSNFNLKTLVSWVIILEQKPLKKQHPWVECMQTLPLIEEERLFPKHPGFE